MKPFTEDLRYSYPLTPNSLVLDLGAYHGQFSAEIARRYNCRVLAFEPIASHHAIAAHTLAPYPTVTLHPTGIGPTNAQATFGVKGDMTGLYTSDTNTTETVTLQSIDDVLPLSGCDLLKINIEGGEYDLLEHMLRTRLHLGCRNIQVQFHGNVPSCHARWRSIRYELLASHHLTYDAPFCWENYALGPTPTPFQSHFDAIVVINRDARPDRWSRAQIHLHALGLTRAVRFPAIDNIDYEGLRNGNAGCTASHRAVLEMVAKLPSGHRVLVLEDDFLPLHPHTASLYESMIHQLPPDHDLLYLGGHYADAPIARAAPNIIRCGPMSTTSSYVITPAHAARMAPYLTGIGPIDSLFSGFSKDHRHYILQPRLFAQWTSHSDLCDHTRDNVPCMTDTRHEEMV